MTTRTTLLLAVIVSTMTLGACDDDPMTSGAGGSFTAELEPVPRNAENVIGTAHFAIDDDVFTVELNARGAFPSIPHKTHVYYGAGCPESTADTNGDGWVDHAEGTVAYGAPLIPLDNKLGHQFGGEEGFPIPDASGDIEYASSIRLDALLGSLRPPDADRFAELADGEDLDLGRRAVVIHGIDPSFPLPPTVAAGLDTSSNAALPVACGEIRPG